MIVIAELINATRKKVREAVIARDEERIKGLVISQKKGGGDYIDINVGTGRGDAQDEMESMRWAVNAAKQAVEGDISLSIDSANHDVLKAGLEEAPKGRSHFINSVTAESERLEPTLQLAVEFEANVIALAMGDDGIQVEVEKRVEAASVIREKAAAMNIPDDRLYFDPLVMPLGTDPRNPLLTIETGREIKKRFPDVHLCMGLSNVSHGLPERKLLNRVFLVLAMQAGFDSALIDPTDKGMMDTLKAADALLGNDLDEPDLTASRYMGSAAELAAELPDRDDTHTLLPFVLLFEVSHRPGAFCFVERHLPGLHRKVVADDRVGDVLHAGDLLCAHPLEVGEVEA